MSFIILCLFATACAGTSRWCSSCYASSTGADWLVVTYKMDGTPFRCWRLKNVSLTDEQGGGIYWEGRDGNLVHLGGWYNRVQVNGTNWESAAGHMGVELDSCER